MRDISLTVIFDIDQDSQLLQWAFTANGEPISGKGVETGLLAFERNDILTIQAFANSQDGGLKQVIIEDCHIITTPRAFTARENPARAGQFPQPSPFGQNGAVISLGQGAFVGSNTQAEWQPGIQLECTEQGRWEMSFVMTTAISRTSDTPEGVERRVFGFDPELEVGAGT